MSIKKKKKKKSLQHYPPLGLKSLTSTIRAVRYLVHRSMLKTMIADVLRAFEIKVLSIHAILTMEKIERRDSKH
jgi:hypothetical protein